MKIDVNMGIFVVGSNPENAIGPDEHDAEEGEPVEGEREWVQIDIIVKLSLDLVVAVEQFAD